MRGILRNAIVLLLVVTLLGRAPAGASQWTLVAGLEVLLKSADAVVAAEILHVDDSATAVDGPLILEVEVLAAPKGRVTVGQRLRVWEAAQMAGTYHPGERRLLLLKRQKAVESYHRKAQWWNIPTGLEVFVEEPALGTLTFEALQQWLREVTRTRQVPALEIRVRGRPDSTLELAVTIANTGTQFIRFNPSRVAASFDVAQRHFLPRIAWESSAAEDWVTLEPGKQFSGVITVDAELPADTPPLPVTIGHLCLIFPSPRAWVGYVTVEVPLQASASTSPAPGHR